MGLDSSIFKEEWGEVKKGKNGWDVREMKQTEVMYLRKANQIHNYFCEKFGKGDDSDNCEKLYITIDDIKELKEICEEILEKVTVKEDFIDGGVAWGSIRGHKGVDVYERGVKEDGGLTFVKKGKKPISDVEVGEIIGWFDGGHVLVEEIRGLRKSKGEEPNLGILGRFLWVGGKIVNEDIPRKLLPTTDGFFFGSTSYDEAYLQDLKDYIKQAKLAIEDYEELEKKGESYKVEYYYFGSY